MLTLRSLVAAAFGLAASCVLAEVEIVDRTISGSESRSQNSAPVNSSSQSYQQVDVNPAVTNTGVSTTDVSANGRSEPSNVPAPIVGRTTATAANSSAEMFYQMQVMQQELLELRGLVEEQAFQIKKLKQQRLDDYVDLDRRISSLGSAPSSVTTNSPGASQPTPNSTGSANSPSSGGPTDEKSDYQRAIDPIIGSNKDLDLAISRLNEHLARFPKGRFEGNVQYWLGEVYLVKEDLNASKRWFESLLNDYPLHNKIPASKYKLGIVYHRLGLDAQAKILLEEVSKAAGPAAARAKDYLDSNF